MLWISYQEAANKIRPRKILCISTRSFWRLCWSVGIIFSLDGFLINSVRAPRCHLVTSLVKIFCIYLRKLILVVCIK